MTLTNPATRRRLAFAVLACTTLWAAIMLLSLRTGWLDRFFFDTTFAHVQGIDFFPIERGWLNLLDGRSMFDTFRSTYGPRATWLVYHPAIVLLLGPALMAFQPWTAYAVWSCISLLLLATAAFVIARQTTDPLRRALIALLLLGGFPTFILLYSGNVQAILVLALALIFTAIDQIKQSPATNPRAPAKLLAGLLLSLFSKPLVLPMLLLLLLLPETRRTALRALGIYTVVSLLLLVVPAANPLATDWRQRWHLLTHLDIVRSTMNVYTNGLTVTRDMQDNAIHWLGALGFTSFRFQHIDVYSLPVFLDGLLHTSTPNALYQAPLLLCLETSLLVALLRSRQARLEAALYTLMAFSLLHFVSYGLVWEYHYTGVFPAIALLLTRSQRQPPQPPTKPTELPAPRWFIPTVLTLGILLWLPTLFVFLHHADLSLLTNMTLLRTTRVLPATALFALFLYRATQIALTDLQGLRWLPTRQAPKPHHILSSRA